MEKLRNDLNALITGLNSIEVKGQSNLALLFNSIDMAKRILEGLEGEENAANDNVK